MATDDLITNGGNINGRVGSHDSMHGAVLATEQLIEQGFQPNNLRIVPAALRPLPGWRERVGRRPHGLMMITVSTIALVGLGLLLQFGARLSAPPAWSIVMLGAAVLGGLAWWGDVARAAATRRAARAERRVATRFDVTCRRDVRRAERTLARWRDPAAPPATRDSASGLAA